MGPDKVNNELFLFQMAGSNDKTTSLARYLTELTLLDADTYLPFVPSIIGKSYFLDSVI